MTPKYDGKGLEAEIRTAFKDETGKDITFSRLKIKPTLAITYDTLNRQGLVFKNTNPKYSNIPVYEVCKSSCSAPTYFPGHVMQIENAKIPLIDGGVVANNPTACAIAEGIKVNKSPESPKISTGDFVVASFGTGELTRPISIEATQEWGALEWAIPIIDVLFDGSADAVDL